MSRKRNPESGGRSRKEAGGTGRTSGRVLRTAILYIALGALILFLRMWVETLLSKPLHQEVEFLFRLLEDIAIALASVGIIGIILDFREWREYFQARLADIVVQRSYLKTLGKEALIALQVDTLKAFFGKEDIDREGSFLHHFQSRLHGLIGDPYRERVNDVMYISVATDRPDLFAVDDCVTYTCRAVGGVIQPEVRWVPEQDEFESVQSWDVALRPPSDWRPPHTISDVWTLEGDAYRWSSDSYPERDLNDFIGLPLDDFLDCDGLFVEVNARYRVPCGNLQTWTMAHPTRVFAVTIQHPPNCRLRHQFIGVRKSDVKEFKRPGIFNANCETWVMPDSGLAFQLIYEEGHMGRESTRGGAKTPPPQSPE